MPLCSDRSSTIRPDITRCWLARSTARRKPSRCRMTSSPEELSLREVSEAIRHGETTSVAVTESLLARIEVVQPRINCFISVDRDGAIAAAEVADREIAQGRWRGPLHGVPLAHKDAFDREGPDNDGRHQNFRSASQDNVHGHGPLRYRRRRPARTPQPRRIRGRRHRGQRPFRPLPQSLEHRPYNRRLVERLRCSCGGAGSPTARSAATQEVRSASPPQCAAWLA